jgi:hypothetical protein
MHYVFHDEDNKGESHVYRAVKNTKHLKMAMFLCAQARPRCDHNANQMWDGKIGMWPIGQFQPAARASANQPRGALVWHTEKVNKDRYRALLLEKVIPSSNGLGNHGMTTGW